MEVLQIKCMECDWEPPVERMHSLPIGTAQVHATVQGHNVKIIIGPSREKSK